MAQIIKKGPSYMVRITWRDVDGKQHKKSKSGFKTKAEARKAAAEMENAKYSCQVAVGDPTFVGYFEDWYQTYKANKVSHSTSKAYQQAINLVRREFGTMKLSKVTRRHYQLFINRFGANHSKNTVMQDHTIIRTCVKDAVSEGLIQKDFTDRIELVWDKRKGREIKYLSVKEINRLVDYALSHPTVENRLIVAGLYTGARLGELSALTWQDVNEPFKTVTISKSMEAHTREIKEPKNKYSKRTIRVNQAFFDLIKSLKGSSDLIFGPIVPKSVQVNKQLRADLTALNIGDGSYHFHSLRHSHVALLLANGVPLFAISQRLGHSSMTITANTYAYMIDEFKNQSDRQIVQALDALGVPKSVPTSSLSIASDD